MTVDLSEEEINLDDVLQPRMTPHASPVVAAVAPATTPHAGIAPESVVLQAAALNIDANALVAHVESESLRELFTSIFFKLTRLLDYLRHIEKGLAQDKTLEKTVILFRLVNAKSLSLRDYINARINQTAEIESGFKDVLDLTSYAINHELRRVFEKEFPKLAASEPAALSRADLTRAYGLLHNCFQQSIITLAQTFDPKLDGAHLFEDYKIKIEQSIELDKELSSLLQQVRRAEREAGVLLKLALINRVKAFRDGTMHYLMYKDWEEFEGFVEEIIKTYDEMENLTPVIHRFASYLETLLQHVRMRAVLSAYYPDAQPTVFKRAF